jgi:hypothetical protein
MLYLASFRQACRQLTANGADIDFSEKLQKITEIKSHVHDIVWNSR